MTSARHLVRQLTGRSHHDFVSLLRAQVHTDLRAVDLLCQALDGTHRQPAADQLVDIEHDGDEQRSALVAELSRAFTTPMDREDLFRVSSSIDDVLDNLRDFARELELYRPRSVVRFGPILDIVSEALHALDRSIGELTNGSPSVLAEAKAANSAGSKVRRLYQSAVGELLQGDELSMEVLRQRELLRRLDVVALRLGEAADALSDGILKRSQ
jgi:uncharacterized protein Yka (UPF0111/DUF47 family)